jgi:ADP-L-glycero-D-manno-heptose 6-epimerase
MLVVTGGAGFVGSNLIEALNQSGRDQILLVDDLTDASKIANLADLAISDYADKDEFLIDIERHGMPESVKGVFHQGACSDTMATDGHDVMSTNYVYSKKLFLACARAGVSFIYASSASVYGRDGPFGESGEGEQPLNAYAYSKFLFDRHVSAERARISNQVVGLRYFNVYGPREDHKSRMASVVWHIVAQYHEGGAVRLFEGSGGYGPGEQRRDFVYVQDVARVNLFFLDNPSISGIFNVGTGASRSFNEVALVAINACRNVDGDAPLGLSDAQSQKVLNYFPMPQALAGKYQNFTEATINQLQSVGYSAPWTSLEEGVARYARQRYQALKSN